MTGDIANYGIAAIMVIGLSNDDTNCRKLYTVTIETMCTKVLAEEKKIHFLLGCHHCSTLAYCTLSSRLKDWLVPHRSDAFISAQVDKQFTPFGLSLATVHEWWLYDDAASVNHHVHYSVIIV